MSEQNVQMIIKALEMEKMTKMTKEEAVYVLNLLKRQDLKINSAATEAIDMAISALEKQEQDRWHVVAKEGNPKKNGEYLVTRGFIPYLDIVKKVGDPPIASDIVAWRPLPEPYTEEES